MQTNNKSILGRIQKLTDEIDKNPRNGIEKPELLKRDLSGYWSRRINSEHRFVYHIDDKKFKITIISLRFHY
ncbi:MAG: Txe/YoeB family addiction module toxin [Saprospiraceae bacterium]|nr:Txe/YoeB family addiction module toxin [Saprospiraceae bacterium]